MKHIAVLVFVGLCFLTSAAGAGDLPEGYWPEEVTQPILDKTVHLELSPDLSGLSDGERVAVDRLIEVGRIFQRLYEQSRHRESLAAYEELLALDRRLGSPKATRNLIDLYYLSKGPISRKITGERGPFLPVDARPPGRNVYPWGVGKDEMEAFLSKYPESRPWLLGVRSVVRRSDPGIIQNDLTVLDAHPELDTLHPGLRDMLEALLADAGDKSFYALPYSVAYAEPLTQTYRYLNEAADAVEDDDPEFAGYLRNRSRDLLSDNYESGDASWVTGHFRHLNAQIGSYEVYDDALYGVKSFFGLNVLLRDREQSDALRAAIQGLQEFENALPYSPPSWDGKGDKKKVREDIPVGVYNIIADFGQSRGTNTATILPNESEYARKYGRTILIRYNIVANPVLFEMRRKAFAAAVAGEFAGDLTADGGFYRTLWHEIGHYLGVDRTRDGRELGEALESDANKLEELKADLVSLFLVERLREKSYYTPAEARAVYADGIRRVLLKSKPSRSQTYQTMELMQMNFYLENGLLEYDAGGGKLAIHYDRYPEVVRAMLEKVLALQQNGDKAAADAFIDRYAVWDESLQGALAEAMKDAETYRYAMVTYKILE